MTILRILLSLEIGKEATGTTSVQGAGVMLYIGVPFSFAFLGEGWCFLVTCVIFPTSSQLSTNL